MANMNSRQSIEKKEGIKYPLSNPFEVLEMIRGRELQTQMDCQLSPLGAKDLTIELLFVTASPNGIAHFGNPLPIPMDEAPSNGREAPYAEESSKSAIGQHGCENKSTMYHRLCLAQFAPQATQV
jgi:hypothetical protein